MGNKKTRVRLSNEEKEVGMTIAEKKNGVTIAKKKRKNTRKVEEVAPVEPIVEGADLKLDEATIIELVEGEETGVEKLILTDEPAHSVPFMTFKHEEPANEDFVPLESEENVDTLSAMPEKTQQDLNESFNENSSTGLGDIVNAVTTVTGIKSLVKFFTPEGEDCGCEERRKKLNELHLRGKEPFCLELDEYTFLKGFFDSNPFEANASQAMQMRTIYARIFRMDVSQVGSCSGCMRDLINELKAIVGTYE
jgi:hypothetical protein